MILSMQLSTKLLLALLCGLFISVPRLLPQQDLTGKIVAVSPVIDGPIASRNITVQLDDEMITAQQYETQVNYREGDIVLLQMDAGSGQYTVADFARTPQLAQLFILFLLAVVLVTGGRGLRSLLGLLSSFGVIFALVLPQIIAGSNPILVIMVAACLILFFSYYLTHGVDSKTTLAVIGTSISLVLTTILAYLYTQLTNLSGYGSEEATFLLTELPNTNMQSLLLAGMIIATLGVLDDITISQASVVYELKRANRRLGVYELFSRAMRVGQDHIASVVNTLVLVYTGTALPLLLLFTDGAIPTFSLLNYEAVAEEIVRTLVGSIGLVVAVPITTIVAAYWYGTTIKGEKN